MRLVALALLLAATEAMAATPEQEKYQINAQYTDPGASKKLSSLGEAQVSYARKGASEFTVRLDATVKDPRDNRLYEFHVDSDYVAAGRMITMGNQRNRYNEAAQEYRSKVESVVPFLYLVKYQVPGDHGAEKTFRYRGTDYVLRFAHTERHIEASLYEEQSLIGKFFLQKDAGKIQNFDKFRVPTAGKVSLTFVRL